MIRSTFIYFLFIFSYLYGQENIKYSYSINDAINETDNTKALDLSNSDFHFLPDNISKLSKLVHFKLFFSLKTFFYTSLNLYTSLGGH